MSIPREKFDMDDEENEPKSKVPSERVKSQIEWVQSRIAQMNEVIQIMEGMQKKNTLSEAEANFEIKNLEEEIQAVEVSQGAPPTAKDLESDFLSDLVKLEKILERVDSMDTGSISDSSDGSACTEVSSDGGFVREFSPD